MKVFVLLCIVYTQTWNDAIVATYFHIRRWISPMHCIILCEECQAFATHRTIACWEGFHTRARPSHKFGNSFHQVIMLMSNRINNASCEMKCFMF